MAMQTLTDEQFRTVERLAAQCLETGAPLSAALGYTQEQMEAVYNVAYNLYQQQKNEDAKTLFRFLTLHEQTDSRFWLGLAGCYQRLGEYMNAINAYSYLAVIDATNPLYAFHAGECYMALRDWEQAQKALEAVTTLCDIVADEGRDHSELLKRAELMAQAISKHLDSQ